MTRRLALLGLLTLTGCQKLASLMPQKAKVLKSADGVLQLTVPGAWADDSAPDRKMNEQAVLQASNRDSELYVIVLTEPKAALNEMDLARFSELTRGSQLRAMDKGIEEGPRPRTVNGMKGIEYVLKGRADDADVVLKHVALEGSNAFHQVVAWTLKTEWDKQKAGLDKVIDSLKETAPVAK